VGLARAAAHTGYRTYFTTAADLAPRCHRAAIEGRWATTMRFYAGPTLLVIDELGYLSLRAEAAAVTNNKQRGFGARPATGLWQ
jgi:DNA replication protein DnaC